MLNNGRMPGHSLQNQSIWVNKWPIWPSATDFEGCAFFLAINDINRLLLFFLSWDFVRFSLLLELVKNDRLQVNLGVNMDYFAIKHFKTRLKKFGYLSCFLCIFLS